MRTKKIIKRREYNLEYPIYSGMGVWCELCHTHGLQPKDYIYEDAGVKIYPGEVNFNYSEKICDYCLEDLELN